jgi:hypothetical protein
VPATGTSTVPGGLAAIHQPNLFPWLGYFNKLARADVFVVLDDAQYQKTGSSWSNRVKLVVAGQAKWVTAPIRRAAHGVQTIAQLEWDEQPWRDKLLKTLQLQYGRAPYYAEAMELLQPLVRNPQRKVCAYNLDAVRAIAQALGLRPRIELASAFGVGSSGTLRLVQLVQRAGCRRYLVGGGAGGYQDDALFAGTELELQYQAFVPQPYPQQGVEVFIPGMSIIDPLMNCGLVRTRELVVS